MREYSCTFGPTAETVAVDLVELTPADDKPLVVIALELFQSSDFGDAQSEIIPHSLVRGNATSGSGGVAAANANPVNPSDATSGFTYEALNTTAASAGTAKTIFQGGWQVLAGYLRVFVPEERREVSQGNTLLCWRLGAAPADSLTIGGEATVGEAG